jgi:hypothetical protein
MANKITTANCDEFEDPDDTAASTTITVSSDMRRTILGTATPYRVSEEMITHHVVGSANFSIGKDAQTEIEIFPLSHLKQKDPRWLKPVEGVVCFHCCHGFETAPVWIPQSLDSKGIYWVRPTPFCSLNCAKAHLVEMNSFAHSQQMMLLHRVARDVYGHCDDKIVASPARQCLEMFGGPMSIVEFRAEHQHARVNIEAPPFTPLNMFIERSPHMQAAQEPVSKLGELEQKTSIWNVSGLRRPSVPQALPRAPPGPSMLKEFVGVKRSNGKWDADQFNAPRVVTSQTPSVQQVKEARHATLQAQNTNVTCLINSSNGPKPRRPRRSTTSGAKQIKDTQASGNLMKFVEK